MCAAKIHLTGCGAAEGAYHVGDTPSRKKAMDYITLLGLLAGVLTTTAFVPQVVKTWRTKSAEDISLVMFIMLVTGIVLWLAYGLLIRSLPLILSNGIAVFLTGSILYFKLRYE